MNTNTNTTFLPTSTVQCHASNLLQLPDRTLLCVWFGGTQEGCHDISIYLSRLSPDSQHWSPPQKVSADSTRSEQNPVLFRDPKSGQICLFHTAQEAGNQDGAIIVTRISHDDGHTWSAPTRPFPNAHGVFIRQPLVVLDDGSTWVLPIWHCRTPPGYRWTGSDDVSAVLYTRDGGLTWSESSVPSSTGCVHMNIVPLQTDGSYVAFFRSRWADNIYKSTSKDCIAWTPPTRTSLPNPNSGICAAALPGNKLAMVFNRSSANKDMERREGLYDDITPASDQRENQPGVEGRVAIWGTPRNALTVAISDDQGATWLEKVLEDGDGVCMTNNSREGVNKELSYPNILVEDTRGQEVTVHVTYTHHRQRIKHVKIEDVERFVRG